MYTMSPIVVIKELFRPCYKAFKQSYKVSEEERQG